MFTKRNLKSKSFLLFVNVFEYSKAALDLRRISRNLYASIHSPDRDDEIEDQNNNRNDIDDTFEQISCSSEIYCSTESLNTNLTREREESSAGPERENSSSVASIVDKENRVEYVEERPASKVEELSLSEKLEDFEKDLSENDDLSDLDCMSHRTQVKVPAALHLNTVANGVSNMPTSGIPKSRVSRLKSPVRGL